MRFTINCWLIPLVTIGVALFAPLPAPAQLATIEGEPRVIDGDTIEIDGERIRLEGIDTPEQWQRCRDSRGGGVSLRPGSHPRAAAPHRLLLGALRSPTRPRSLRPPHRLLLHVWRHRHQRLAGEGGPGAGLPEVFAPLRLRGGGGAALQAGHAPRRVHRALGLAQGQAADAIADLTMAASAWSGASDQRPTSPSVYRDRPAARSAACSVPAASP